MYYVTFLIDSINTVTSFESQWKRSQALQLWVRVLSRDRKQMRQPYSACVGSKLEYKVFFRFSSKSFWGCWYCGWRWLITWTFIPEGFPSLAEKTSGWTQGLVSDCNHPDNRTRWKNLLKSSDEFHPKSEWNLLNVVQLVNPVNVIDVTESTGITACLFSWCYL